MVHRITLMLVFLSSAFALPLNAQSLIASIPVSGTPYQIAVNPTTNRIYVSLSTSTGPAVGVIDGKTNKVVDTIPVTSSSNILAVDEYTGRVYVPGCTYGQEDTCYVQVIDGKTDTIAATISFSTVQGFGAGIQGIAVDPIRNRIYLTDDNDFQIITINGKTNTVETRTPTNDQELLGVASDYVSNRIVAASSGYDIDVISGSTGKIDYVQAGTGINQYVAVNSFTGRAYVTNQETSYSLPVVNLATRKQVANIPLTGDPYDVAVDYVNNLVFVTLSDGTVAIFDGNTNAQLGSAAVPSSFIDVSPLTNLVYTSGIQGSNVVNVISEK
jgi:YVTN family beta-propeller protein